MKIPSRVRVGGHTIKVFITKKMPTDDPECYGLFNAEKNTIYINADLSQSYRESTFMHEIMHAMNSTINHEFLDSLSEQFYQVLSQNNLLK